MPGVPFTQAQSSVDHVGGRIPSVLRLADVGKGE